MTAPLPAHVTAAVLAGGLGTRLRSVTADRPKVLAVVRGRPWISYILDQLDAAGLREAVLLTGYQAEEVRDELGETHGGLRLTYSPEPTPLGTGGALRHACARWASSHLLLLNGDSYIDVELGSFFDFHRRKNAALSLVLAHAADASRFGQVKIAADERVVSFEEKKASGPGWINAGVYLFERRLIEQIPAHRFVSLEREMFAEWQRGGDMFGFSCAGQFLDIGTPESYALAEEFFVPLAVRRLARAS